MKSSGLKFSKKPKIAIVYRPDKAEASNLAMALTNWLIEKKYQVHTAPQQKKIARTTLIKKIDEMQKMGLVLVLGGDGTYLRAVRLLRGSKVPILGINLGSLGFLTPTRSDAAFAAVEHTLKGKMELHPRSMLQIDFYRKGKKTGSYLGLNDVVVERGQQSLLINIAVHSGRFLVSEIKADGIILATPTGSTAYNLAAGGPLMHPNVSALVVTPISAHSLTSRPLIVPDDQDLKFQITHAQRSGPCGRLVIDGDIVTEVFSDDEIVVRRNREDHWMVHEPGHNDFLLMREKLKFGERS